MQKSKSIVLLFILSVAATAYAATLRRVAIVDLPGDPGFNGVAMAAGNVVISRPGTNTIEIFSPVKRRVVARISQVQGPRGIAVDDEGARVYVALSGSDSVAVINSHNWQVEKLLQVQQQPEQVLWVPQTKTLYVTSTLNRTVSSVDPITGRETNVIQMNALPEDMVYDRAHQHLLVSLQDVRQIAVVDLSNNRIINRFNLVASEPTGLALDSARNLLYVAVRYAVLALNLETGSEAYRIPAPGGTDTLVLDPDGNLLYAAGGDGSVLAIDLNRRIVDHELPTDVKGFSIAYDRQRHMLFMPGAREGRSKMVILRPISSNIQNR
ncbi:MAG: YncE family protein, partial [Actinomycetota bacterium]